MSERVSSDTGGKQLARVKGIVGYQVGAATPFKAIFGQFDLPDDYFAVTKPNGQAVLRLADSSEIDIGGNTSVQVGAFNAAQSGNPNTITLNGGALHFNIRHPQGGQSNYKFQTATSQIAVRGTEGFLIAGANGTQVVCVSCAAGDVTVQVGQQTISVVTNQTLTVLGTNGLNATTSITSNLSAQNPAVNQFNGNASATGTDPTGSLSGSTGGAAGTGAGAGAGLAAGAGAAAAAAVVATVTKPGTSSPQAISSPLPVVGTLAININFPSATTFPMQFSWPFNQNNATSPATFSCSPSNVITCNATQSISSSGLLSGFLGGTLNSAGSFTLSGSANGYNLSPTTFNVYGAVTMTQPAAAPIAFTQVPASLQVTVTQAPNGSSMSATINCPGGATAAQATITGGTGASPFTFTVNAIAASTASPPPAVACTITVAGQGDGPRASLSIPVDITSTGIGISSHRRKTN
jgi:FecR protein